MCFEMDKMAVHANFEIEQNIVQGETKRQNQHESGRSVLFRVDGTQISINLMPILFSVSPSTKFGST